MRGVTKKWGVPVPPSAYKRVWVVKQGRMYVSALHQRYSPGHNVCAKPSYWTQDHKKALAMQWEEAASIAHVYLWGAFGVRVQARVPAKSLRVEKFTTTA